MNDGCFRKNIKVDQLVNIVQKHHQRTGELTEGIVSRILTKSPQHPHGIKVQLTTGEVGRVQEIIDEDFD
ncbi:YwbE family protein [bacterium]|nr:YwbE family protein [bacterium]